MLCRTRYPRPPCDIPQILSRFASRAISGALPRDWRRGFDAPSDWSLDAVQYQQVILPGPKAATLIRVSALGRKWMAWVPCRLYVLIGIRVRRACQEQWCCPPSHPDPGEKDNEDGGARCRPGSWFQTTTSFHVYGPSTAAWFSRSRARGGSLPRPVPTLANQSQIVTQLPP
jgi:hypothetical protein